jgi:hypothetical protein
MHTVESALHAIFAHASDLGDAAGDTVKSNALLEQIDADVSPLVAAIWDIIRDDMYPIMRQAEQFMGAVMSTIAGLNMERKMLKMQAPFKLQLESRLEAINTNWALLNATMSACKEHRMQCADCSCRDIQSATASVMQT